jgi:hypothetical protein
VLAAFFIYIKSRQISKLHQTATNNLQLYIFLVVDMWFGYEVYILVNREYAVYV